MSTTIIRPANREIWLATRQNGIGSSEVATIVGLNPFETPYQLFRRKRGIDPAKAETFAMKAGHYLEDAVAQFWHDETGKEIIKRSAIDWIIRSDERPYMQVSPDRTYWLDEGRGANNKGILECKTTQRAIDGDDIPKHWFVQVQYQLGVAELQHGSLAWLTQGKEFGYRNIDLVPDFFGWICEEVDKFYNDCIVGGREPEAIDVQDVLIKYGRHTDGKTTEVSEELYKQYLELKELRKEIDLLDARKEELESKLKVAFEDSEALTYMGQTIATWKAPKPSIKLDAKAFQAAYPEQAQAFMVESQGSRRFLLK